VLPRSLSGPESSCHSGIALMALSVKIAHRGDFTRLSLEHFLELVEESARGRAVFIGFQLGEFLEQFALAAAERLRRLDIELHVKIAHILAAQHRHALALEADALARLGAGRDL